MKMKPKDYRMTLNVRKYNAEFERMAKAVRRFVARAALLGDRIRSISWRKTPDGDHLSARQCRKHGTMRKR